MTFHPRRAIALVVLGATGGILVPPAHGAPGPGDPAGLPLRQAEQAPLGAARARVQALERAAAQTRQAEASARERVDTLAAQAEQVAARLNELGAEERALARELQTARERLRKLAVASYVNGGSTSSVDYLLRARTPADLTRRRKLLTSVGRIRNQAVQAYTAARQAASERLQLAVAALERINAAGAAARSELASATGELGRLNAELDAARRQWKLLLAVTPVGATGIPGLFLDAYRAAASAMARMRPGCGIRWTAVAGVGRIESNHGRSGDARLAPTGDISPPIIGIPLDGNNNTAVISDTDAGAFDGDVVFDRAVGPMQVIPSTWHVVAHDGNGDGVTNPNNVFDAALSAAVYLCRAAPGGLASEEALKVAFFSYNHSESYSLTALHWSKVYDGLPTPRGPIVPT
jgi:hypothetical protein